MQIELQAWLTRLETERTSLIRKAQEARARAEQFEREADELSVTMAVTKRLLEPSDSGIVPEPVRVSIGQAVYQALGQLDVFTSAELARLIHQKHPEMRIEGIRAELSRVRGRYSQLLPDKRWKSLVHQRPLPPIDVDDDDIPLLGGAPLPDGFLKDDGNEERDSEAV